MPHPDATPPQQCDYLNLNTTKEPAHLELAGHHAASSQCSQVQLQQRSTQQPRGHVTSHDALRKPLHDCRLANTCSDVVQQQRNMLQMLTVITQLGCTQLPKRHVTSHKRVLPTPAGAEAEQHAAPAD
jgi:hypothetical protein